MDIESQLLKEHSKQNATKVADYIGTNSTRFAELFQLFNEGDSRTAQRAAYSLGMVTDNHPELIKPYIGQMINNLDHDIIEAVKRNTVRTLQNIKIPSAHEGKLTQKCFDFLISKDESIAVKVFSMTILGNVTVKYPELKNELVLIIEELMEYGTPGIISRGKRTLKQLDKINPNQ